MKNEEVSRALPIFVRHYVAAILWSTTGGDGEPLDAECDFNDLALETLETVNRECKEFLAAAHKGGCFDIEDDAFLKQAGHDFALTRNGHGAGFWDGDWPEPEASKLTKLSEVAGETYWYVGDDGLVYG